MRCGKAAEGLTQAAAEELFAEILTFYSDQFFPGPSDIASALIDGTEFAGHAMPNCPLNPVRMNERARVRKLCSTGVPVNNIWRDA
jgi:hypothetical protein